MNLALLIGIILVALGNPPSGYGAQSPAAACDKDRVVLTEYQGVVNSSNSNNNNNNSSENYTENTHCQWLIRPGTVGSTSSPGIIHLEFSSFQTECSYDYVFIYDGSDPDPTKLIASLSGDRVLLGRDHGLLAHSGSMLIIFFSDLNYVLAGFRAKYVVLDCPHNCSGHGNCQKQFQTCQCHPGWLGPSCDVPACPGDCQGQGTCDPGSGCSCQDGFGGDDCSLELPPRNVSSPFSTYPPLTSRSSWHRLPGSRVHFMARTGHSSVYLSFTDSLYFFGGKNLGLVLEGLTSFNIGNQTWDRFSSPGSISASAPGARYDHACSSMPEGDGFLISGGVTSSGNSTNDLWLFQPGISEWRLVATNQSRDDVVPPPLSQHTLTLAGNYVYLFGGFTSSKFSSKMFKISAADLDHWRNVPFRGSVKQEELRITGHSIVFHAHTGSLILYGGIQTDVARFSQMNKDMFLFNLEHETWSKLSATSAAGPSGVPRPRAFHSASVIGDLMVVFGGYVHKHNSVEECYDRKTYFYHLKCQVWMSDAVIPSANRDFPVSAGLFGHSAAVVREGLLVISGGYRGTVSDDLLAFPLPELGDCFKHTVKSICEMNPDCGWCSSNKECLARKDTDLCSTNLQTTVCPKLCPSLTSCLACVQHPECRWCVAHQTCRYQSFMEISCGKTLELDISECLAQDIKPGLTMVHYESPVNTSRPDHVRIVSGGLIPTPESISSSSNPNGLTKIVGSITIPKSSLIHSSNPSRKERLQICPRGLSNLIVLMARTPKDSLQLIKQKHYRDKTVSTKCITDLNWGGDGRTNVILKPGGIYPVRMELRSNHSSAVDIPQNYSLVLRKSQINWRVSEILSSKFLIPYQNGVDCLAKSKIGCLTCLIDSQCVWCSRSSLCLSRLDALENADCWLDSVTDPETCSSCSDRLGCKECLAEGEGCEWVETDAKCARAGKFDERYGSVILKQKSQCRGECQELESCGDCLSSSGRCVWCEERQECFLFSHYTSKYIYGQCNRWVDFPRTPRHVQTWESRPSGESQEEFKSQLCLSCGQMTNCSSCLRNLNCGWCRSDPEDENPIDLETRGTCLSGSFSGSKNCPDQSLWFYEHCPDIDECALGLDNCLTDATCINLLGAGFQCQCKPGFRGDGVEICDQTCLEDCGKYGNCSGHPNYQCQCQLGWTGARCDQDCGCHFHSSCQQGGIGICDECFDNTMGPNCESCIPESYGNATQRQGCRKCECHGHGDSSSGMCDPAGVCFCKDNTQGVNCEQCRPGYYGDPRNGQPCYEKCYKSKNIFQGQVSGHFGSRLPLLGRSGENFTNPAASSPPRECLWIITTEGRSDGRLTKIQTPIDPDRSIELDLRILSILCQRSMVYVYDGLPSFVSPMEASRSGRLLGGFCQRENIETREKRHKLIAHSGIMVVFFVEDHDKDALEKDDKLIVAFKGFNASFRLVKKKKEEKIDHIKKDEKDASKFVLSSSSKLLSRFGHSLDSDSTGETLWLFGGVSHERGPLNDIRAFQIRTRSWHPVTLQTTNNERSCSHDCLPAGRYFHAACLLQSRFLFVHGGTNGSFAKIFQDFWVFDKLESFWQPLLPIPGMLCLAGHTLTSLENREGLLLLVGGYTHESGGHASSKIYAYNRHTSNWSFIAHLPQRKGVFGHTTIYHKETEMVYIYGGQGPSNELRTLHYPTKRWLSPRRQQMYYSLHAMNAPHPRFLHAAADNRNYMVVLGGSQDDSDRFVSIYVYKCKLWINLKQMDFVGSDSRLEALAAAINFHSSSVFLAGGFSSTDSRILDQLIELRLRSDYCDLFSVDRHMCTGMLGCSHCSLYSGNGINSTHCYFNDLEEFGVIPEKCQNIDSGTLEFNKGYPCEHKEIGRQFQEEEADDEEVEVDQGELCASAKKRQECNQRKYRQNCIWNKDGICASLNQDSSRNDTLGAVESSPTCYERMGCESCLLGQSNKDDCLWSQKLTACLSPVSVPLLCAGGLCGQIYTEACPVLCKEFGTCRECLTAGRATCGWCASLIDSDATMSGEGVCVEGTQDDLDSPTFCQDALRHYHASYSNLVITKKKKEIQYVQNLTASNWNLFSCPAENECLNGHGDCDLETESCVDTPDSYECHCKPGYRGRASTDAAAAAAAELLCEPVCSQGCHFGVCVAPDLCRCHFSYVGESCDRPCQCHGHSQCAGPDRLDTCLKCHNNTMGDQCQYCKPFHVGDPRKGSDGKCSPCQEFCHGHSSFCLPSAVLGLGEALADEKNGDVGVLLMPRLLQNQRRGIYPTEDPVCVQCEDHTEGPRCGECQPGYFRSDPEPRVHECQSCKCNGHAHPSVNCGSHGQSCQCGNNTVSDMTPCNWLHLDRDCHSHQCSRCREYFLGDPLDGNQCYRQMNVDSEYCFNMEMSTQRDCSKHHLRPGEVVFFAVQPKFMNVDIRVFLDLSVNATLHVWLSPDSQTFKVYPDTNNQIVFGQTTPRSSDEERDIVRRKQKRGRSLVAQLAANLTLTTKDIASERLPYTVLEKTGSGKEINTFVKLEDAQTVLSVPNVGHRLIISLPESIHDLRTNRFYLAIQAEEEDSGEGGGQSPCYGSLYFRQDQLHIDLFVFFSVFFSCFFLFLSLIILAWHGKSIIDRRQERRRVQIEMVTMAKRPFTKLNLVINDREEESGWFRTAVASGGGGGQSKPLEMSGAAASNKKRSGGGIFRPAAATNTVADSRDVTLPLLEHRREATTGGVNLGPVGNNGGTPVAAIEPTSDGLAGVMTVLVIVPEPSPSKDRNRGLSFGCVLATRNASKEASSK